MQTDPLVLMLWLLSLRLAAGHRLRVELETWPASYRSAVRA